MVTFGPTFLSGAGCKVSRGVAEGHAVSVGLGDGVSAGPTVVDGDTVGVGVGDDFLCVDFVFGVGLGDGVGEILFLFGEAVGDGLGSDFFTGRFRCFRVGVGVGVGSKIFLIFVPNDPSVAPGAATPAKKIAPITRARSVVLIVGNNQRASS
jgi:hypothetical protein